MYAFLSNQLRVNILKTEIIMNVLSNNMNFVFNVYWLSYKEMYLTKYAILVSMNITFR